MSRNITSSGYEIQIVYCFFAIFENDRVIHTERTETNFGIESVAMERALQIRTRADFLADFGEKFRAQFSREPNSEEIAAALRNQGLQP